MSASSSDGRSTGAMSGAGDLWPQTNDAYGGPPLGVSMPLTRTTFQRLEELLMKPTEISLFTEKEQTLLVETENARLADLDEEALAKLLSRVRRARNKYTDLDRRQSIDAMNAAGRRAATSSSNERTRRKAEILEDVTSRVALRLSRVTRANANRLKRERIDAAKQRPSKPKTEK